METDLQEEHQHHSLLIIINEDIRFEKIIVIKSVPPMYWIYLKYYMSAKPHNNKPYTLSEKSSLSIVEGVASLG